MWSSPTAINTSKIHLHVEQFSHKANWKLAEDLLHSQSCRKDIPCNWVGRNTQKRHQDGASTPGRDL